MTSIKDIMVAVTDAAPRVAELGAWPPYINAAESLFARIPRGEVKAGGFDAGIACALDLIPRERQKLAATLHTNYTRDAVDQVRRESIEMDPDSETCWWLVACNLCKEGEVTEESFFAQIGQFRGITESPKFRASVALMELGNMSRRYQLIDGVPFVIRDGGMQAAYLHGYDWGVEYGEAYNLFFVSTLRPTIGVFEREFPFSDRRDKEGNTLSGKLRSGTLQRCKCSSFEELGAVIKMVRENLGDPKTSV